MPVRSNADPPARERVGIQSDTLYTLRSFRDITGWGDHAMRTARRSGLKVRYRGNRGFVLGADFIKYLTQTSST